MSVLTQTAVRSSGSGFNNVVKFETSTGTENGKLCRAFVNFNGISGAIISSFNVNTVSLLGTGFYQINFFNGMAPTSYVVVATAADIGAGTFGAVCQLQNFQSLFFRIVTSQNEFGPTTNNPQFVCAAVFR